MLPLFFAAAVFCWFVALRAAGSISGMVPGTSRFGVMQMLGRWDFDTIRAKAGAAADPHILTYKRAFAGFFVLVLLVVGYSALAFTVGGAGTPPANSLSSSASN